MSKTKLNTDIDNTQTRCPLVVLIDDSSSMSGDPIRQVHDGIELLVQSLQEDDVAAYAVELCITSLNSGIIQEFTPIYDINLQKLRDKLPEADDCTPLGTGIKNSIELLDRLVELYSDDEQNIVVNYVPLNVDIIGCEAYSLKSSSLFNNMKLSTIISEKTIVLLKLNIILTIMFHLS